MTEIGKEIYLSDLDYEILGVFVRRKILDDEAVIHNLRILIEKLRKNPSRKIGD